MIRHASANTASRQTPYRHQLYTMILPVFNEEARVERVVEYYRRFARLIAVDNYSTDNTLSLLKDQDVETVQFKNPGTTQTPECLQYFNSLAKTDYVLYLACSEFIPATLLDLFEETAASHRYDVVSCVRDSYTCGELIPLWGGSIKGLDARIERYFNKHALDLDKVVIHGHFLPRDSNRILYLPRDQRYIITHLRDTDAKSLIIKSTDYAFVEAHHRSRKGKQVTCFKLTLLFLKEVIRFFQLPFSKWNKIALREIWARMIMHSVTYWVGWELRTGKNIEYSHERNEELWRKLVAEQSESSRKP